jgi:hypothetical protein
MESSDNGCGGFTLAETPDKETIFQKGFAGLQ